jgi:hypothetical protein
LEKVSGTLVLSSKVEIGSHVRACGVENGVGLWKGWELVGVRFLSCTDGHQLKWGILALALKGFHTIILSLYHCIIVFISPSASLE